MHAAGKTPRSSIFLCYRRNDSADVTGRIHDRLVQEFPAGLVFMDAESIDSGVNFRTRVQKALGECQVALIIIGPSWTEIRDEKSGLRRLDEEEDNVRFEVETALSRPGLRVIPVRVNGARWPLKKELPESIRALADLNGPEVRRNPDFHHDMDKLVLEIRRYMSLPIISVRSFVLWGMAALIVGLLIWRFNPGGFMGGSASSLAPMNEYPKVARDKVPPTPALPLVSAPQIIAPESLATSQPTSQIGENASAMPSTAQTPNKSRFKPEEDNSPVVRSPSMIPVFQYTEPKSRTLKPAEPSSK